VDAAQILIRQRAAVVRRDPLQYFLGALWIGNRKTGLLFDAAHLTDNASAFVQQRDDASVERIDLCALSGQRLVSLPECHPCHTQRQNRPEKSVSRDRHFTPAHSRVPEFYRSNLRT